MDAQKQLTITRNFVADGRETLAGIDSAVEPQNSAVEKPRPVIMSSDRAARLAAAEAGVVLRKKEYWEYVGAIRKNDPDDILEFARVLSHLIFGEAG